MFKVFKDKSMVAADGSVLTVVLGDTAPEASTVQDPAIWIDTSTGDAKWKVDDAWGGNE